MEIYRNSSDRNVMLAVPLTAVTGTMNVSIMYDGEEVFNVPTVTAVTGGYQFTLPFFLTTYDRQLDVRWTFDYVEGSETYNYDETMEVSIVTPLLTIEEVQAINSDLSVDDAKAVESQIRHIIQNITGQNFGMYVGKRWIVGDGGSAMKLPQRLIDFTSIESNLYTFNNAAYTIRSGGFYLEQNTASLLTIKEMPPEESLEHGAVITTPYAAYYAGFRRNAKYIINGRWGYAAVPADIKLAAKLLVGDYACPEAAYRDKFLESIRSGDWAMQFSSASWENTGNVRADQLISPYILWDWAMI